jgi:low temperature requirement protein LtrA
MSEGATIWAIFVSVVLAVLLWGISHDTAQEKRLTALEAVVNPPPACSCACHKDGE